MVLDDVTKPRLVNCNCHRINPSKVTSEVAAIAGNHFCPAYIRATRKIYYEEKQSAKRQSMCAMAKMVWKKAESGKGLVDGDHV